MVIKNLVENWKFLADCWLREGLETAGSWNFGRLVYFGEASAVRHSSPAEVLGYKPYIIIVAAGSRQQLAMEASDTGGYCKSSR